MSKVQHECAHKLLALIAAANKSDRLLTYQMAAKAVGRDPAKNPRMIAQVCDLLDAAAALAGRPLLALVKVLEKSNRINRSAWAGEDSKPGRGEKIIRRSQSHRFTNDDIAAISHALERLEGKGNRAAWAYVRRTIPDAKLFAILEDNSSLPDDAIDDIDIGDIGSDNIGNDNPAHIKGMTLRYARDPNVRKAVLLRAKGKCEHCGQAGFLRHNGELYLEAHHIIALAADGADRMTNVIALCANDHREAHFGKRRGELEQAMIRKISDIEEIRIANKKPQLEQVG